MTESISKVIPIMLLIAFGYWMQRKELADEHTMHNVKKGIINLALPAVLFIAFMNMDLRKEYFLVSAVTFIMLIVFFLAGELLNKVFRINSPVLAYVTTGYAFGLLGIPLFGGVYGMENVGMLSVFGVGNEFFIWFVYLTIVKQRLNGEKFSGKTILNFIKSPMIIAIVSGLIVNLFGLKRYIENIFILKGLELTLQSVASVTTPLILIVIGYGIRLQKEYLRPAFQFVAIRLLIMLGIGSLVFFLLFKLIVGETSFMFNMAYYTFLILPPPFMIAIFVSEYSTEENAAIISNSVVLMTLSCIVFFIGGVVAAGM